jgi:hypothetical protein
MPTDFGRDLYAARELDSTRTVRGIVLYANGLIRRLETPQGTLDFHPEYGTLVNDIGEVLDEDRITRLEGQYRATVEADKRTQPGSVKVKIEAIQNPDQSTSLQVSIECDSVEGPLELVLTVDAVTLAILGIKRSV